MENNQIRLLNLITGGRYSKPNVPRIYDNLKYNDDRNKFFKLSYVKDYIDDIVNNDKCDDCVLLVTNKGNGENVAVKLLADLYYDLGEVTSQEYLYLPYYMNDIDIADVDFIIHTANQLGQMLWIDFYSFSKKQITHLMNALNDKHEYPDLKVIISIEPSYLKELYSLDERLHKKYQEVWIFDCNEEEYLKILKTNLSNFDIEKGLDDVLKDYFTYSKSVMDNIIITSDILFDCYCDRVVSNPDSTYSIIVDDFNKFIGDSMIQQLKQFSHSIHNISGRYIALKGIYIELSQLNEFKEITEAFNDILEKNINHIVIVNKTGAVKIHEHLLNLMIQFLYYINRISSPYCIHYNVSNSVQHSMNGRKVFHQVLEEAYSKNILLVLEFDDTLNEECFNYLNDMNDYPGLKTYTVLPSDYVDEYQNKISNDISIIKHKKYQAHEILKVIKNYEKDE